MIKIEGVSKSYGNGAPALSNLNLEIEEGEFVFVVGASGSGKSTFIKLLLKELNPTEGTIVVDDVNLSKLKSRGTAKYRRKVGVLFQDFRLLQDRDVYSNIAFAQRVIGASPREIKRMWQEYYLWWDFQKNIVPIRQNCQVVSSRELPLQEHLLINHSIFWLMNLQETLTLKIHGRL